jgi:hypothetical protein
MTGSDNTDGDRDIAVDKDALTDDDVWTDEELAELASAADIDAPLADDAVPLDLGGGVSTLPSWYMPAVNTSAGHATRRRKLVVWAIIAALLGIDAAGLCVTYGSVILG